MMLDHDADGDADQWRVSACVRVPARACARACVCVRVRACADGCRWVQLDDDG